jgi:hypothetical protein
MLYDRKSMLHGRGDTICEEIWVLRDRGVGR